MLDQNFEADQDQDDAAGPFCFGLVEDSEYSADFNADHRKYERGTADKADCLQNPDIQKCEGDADGQCVNAGGYGQSLLLFCIFKIWIKEIQTTFLPVRRKIVCTPVPSSQKVYNLF